MGKLAPKGFEDELSLEKQRVENPEGEGRTVLERVGTEAGGCGL